MNDNFDKAAQRAQQYWYIDGINEVAFGAYCLLIGGYFYLQANLPPGNPLHAVYSMAFIFLILGGAFAMRRGINWAKERLTYPRTGFIGYKRRSRSYRIILAIIAMLIAFLVASLYQLSDLSFDWIPAFNGLIVAAGWAWAASRVGVGRFYLLALICLAGGAASAFAGLGDILGLAVFYGLAGLASLISGICTLVTYLRSNQGDQEAVGE